MSAFSMMSLTVILSRGFCVSKSINVSVIIVCVLLAIKQLLVVLW